MGALLPTPQPRFGQNQQKDGFVSPLVATHLAFHGAEMFFSSSLKMLLSDLMKFKPRLPPMTKREGNRSILCQVFELSPPTELQSLE